MRRILPALGALLLFGGTSCSSESQAAGIVGVYDATQTLQAGNTAILRYWFSADGKWGRSNRQIVSGTNNDLCGSTADTSYEVRADKVYLRDGANTSERTWTLSEGDTMLKLEPGDSFTNGTPANTFKRVAGAQTNRTCNTAFQ